MSHDKIEFIYVIFFDKKIMSAIYSRQRLNILTSMIQPNLDEMNGCKSRENGRATTEMSGLNIYSPNINDSRHKENYIY